MELPVRERIAAMSERDKLETNLGGVADMQRPPDAMFVVDLKTEDIGVREAKRLKIPIIGLVDTNCDPDPVDFVIPGNDDAIRSCKIIIEGIADVARDNAHPVPRRGGGRPPRARGGRAPRGRGAAQREAEEQGAARPRSAPAARRRRPASRRTSPPRRAEPVPRPPGAGAPRERRTFDPDEES